MFHDSDCHIKNIDANLILSANLAKIRFGKNLYVPNNVASLCKYESVLHGFRFKSKIISRGTTADYKFVLMVLEIPVFFALKHWLFGLTWTNDDLSILLYHFYEYIILIVAIIIIIIIIFIIIIIIIIILSLLSSSLSLLVGTPGTNFNENQNIQIVVPENAFKNCLQNIRCFCSGRNFWTHELRTLPTIFSIYTNLFMREAMLWTRMSTFHYILDAMYTYYWNLSPKSLRMATAPSQWNRINV